MTSEIRPFRKINRKKTKEISVGKVKVKFINNMKNRIFLLE